MKKSLVFITVAAAALASAAYGAETEAFTKLPEAVQVAKSNSFFNDYTKSAMYFLAVAIASIGGTKAQSATASVALEGMARNPAAADKLSTPMILGLALMESLVIFVLITPFLI